MDRISKNRWQVRLAALVIFLLGVAAGALALNVYNAWSRAARREEGRAGFERMLDRLGINGEQRTQVQQILDDARKQFREARRGPEPRMEEIRHQTDERLRQVLTPEQFQRLKEEMSKRRRGRRAREGDK